MKSRRSFFKSTASLGLLGPAGLAFGSVAASRENTPAGPDDRAYWVDVACRIARPVLSHLAARTLRARMPVEAAPGVKDRAMVTHLEAFGRLLYGLAPWLELNGLTGGEAVLQREMRDLAVRSLDSATDPDSPDFMNFTKLSQPLVDTAFLAQALLRAPGILWRGLDDRVKRSVVAALKSSRKIPTPGSNNWVMFAATVEAMLLTAGEPAKKERLEDCVRRMLEWYQGDGVYGDGEFHHCDYYNSFVIHPMLLDVLTVLEARDPRFSAARKTVLDRARRHAVVQERMIAPDGTFPVVGRSMAYRFGAFQSLAQIALFREMPGHIVPAQVRGALTAVIRRMIEAPGTFDENGWLRIGFCGHQPSIGESYISTGSLYLCSAVFLPLGLSPEDPFWNGPPAPWTSRRIWSGENLPADHAIRDVRKVEVPDLERPASGAADP